MASPIITPQLRQQQVMLAALPAPNVAPMANMAATVPDFGAAPQGVRVAPYSQAQQNVVARDALIQHGAGIDNIKNPWLRGFARVGDIALGTIAPNIEAMIPGTVGNHNYELAKANAQIGIDQAQAEHDANLEHIKAATRLTNDNATAAETPAGPEYDYKQTDHGLVAIRKGSTEATALVGADGKPLQDPVKAPTNAFELWHTQNPNGTLDDYNKAESKPLSPEEAASLNGIFDHLASKHGLPAGQFKPGMPKADALQIQNALNQAVSRQQGDTHVSISLQGLHDAESKASAASALNSADPATQAAIQSVANGSVKLTDVFGRGASTAQKAQFVAQVKAINPNFNSGDHDIENKARAYYTGGGGGGQTLTAFNTAQTHLQILAQASDALNNGNTQLFNKLANQYATATGETAPTDFNAVKNAVKGEVARSLTGHVTVAEQAELDKDLNSDMSPRQVAGVSHKYISLIDGKKRAMQDNYNASQQGRPDFGNTDAQGPPSGARVRDYTQLGKK